MYCAILAQDIQFATCWQTEQYYGNSYKMVKFKKLSIVYATLRRLGCRKLKGPSANNNNYEIALLNHIG